MSGKYIRAVTTSKPIPKETDDVRFGAALSSGFDLWRRAAETRGNYLGIYAATLFRIGGGLLEDRLANTVEPSIRTVKTALHRLG